MIQQQTLAHHTSQGSANRCRRSSHNKARKGCETVQDCTTCYRMKSPTTAQVTVLHTSETSTPRIAQGGCHHPGDGMQ